jgi:hypothetical protein
MVGSQTIFSQNPKFKDRRLKYDENIGHRQDEKILKITCRKQFKSLRLRAIHLTPG